MVSRVNLGGLVIAGIGFFLTRFTVTLAIYESPVRFYLAGVVPLLLGLGLAAFGVALAVADVEARLARTTASWCLVGLVTMLGLVVLTLFGSTRGLPPDLATVRSQAYLSNFLIGGSVGGTLTGLYAARTRRHRGEIRRQANRLQILNRLLRHEILNAVSVIKGWVTLDGSTDAEPREVIEEQARSIERTIDQVAELARTTGNGRGDPATTDLYACLDAAVSTVNDRLPGARVTMPEDDRAISVVASGQLERVFTILLENAVTHGDDPEPTIEVTTTATEGRVTIRDSGAGLPGSQQRLLESGTIQPFDDPSSGFGLNVVRLLVEDFDGRIETVVTEDGSAITICLDRPAGKDRSPIPTAVADVKPAVPHLAVTFGAAILAGVAYGVTSEGLGGSVAGIGVFYGTASPVVGWLTHEFHSVVFGFVFAGLISVAPDRYRNRMGGHVAVGVGWGIALWVLAAGVIAPIWLQLLGIPATIPNLSAVLLASHVVWGGTLGVLTAVGYERVTPVLARLGGESTPREPVASTEGRRS